MSEVEARSRRSECWRLAAVEIPDLNKDAMKLLWKKLILIVVVLILALKCMCFFFRKSCTCVDLCALFMFLIWILICNCNPLIKALIVICYGFYINSIFMSYLNHTWFEIQSMLRRSLFLHAREKQNSVTWQRKKKSPQGFIV